MLNTVDEQTGKESRSHLKKMRYTMQWKHLPGLKWKRGVTRNGQQTNEAYGGANRWIGKPLTRWKDDVVVVARKKLHQVGLELKEGNPALGMYTEQPELMILGRIFPTKLKIKILRRLISCCCEFKNVTF